MSTRKWKSCPRIYVCKHFWTGTKTMLKKPVLHYGFVGLKTVDTIGICQRPVFSLGVYQHMHQIMSSIGRRSCELTMKEKTPLSHEVVCFSMLDFETSNSKLEVSKSNSGKITSLSKTTSLQREPFFTMFYTINLSPLLVTK